ncbi:MAG TPA: hypothetical protein VFI72_01055 [Candidatus Angelobacter sp.]|nr:hypothetical protein [Candidatus Angelobacter sp.]
MSAKVATIMQPLAMPPLVWIAGTVHQILAQPGEKFFVFSVRDSKQTVILRIADPHTGAPIPVTSDNPIYDLMKEAYFRKVNVEVGYRDFGPDPQAGINKLCIDRVSLVQ